ncbi:MAG: CBS domain-containing protein [Sinobacterium sp.]|nr:CBS domain-containing protein [Sinobacterium sp.]
MSETREVLNRVLAKNLMSSNVITVNSAWGVSALARFFLAHKISGAPVVDEHDKLVGVVTATDIVEFENISHKEKVAITRSSYFEEVIGQQVSESTIEELSLHANENCITESIMTPSIISVASNDSLIDVAALMSKNSIHRVFVVDDEKMVGVISTMDVLKHLGSL